MRRQLAVLFGALVLVGTNVAIHARENLLRDGAVVLLPLAPVDPRSLMQGDYMALRFAVAREAFGWRMEGKGRTDGHIVLDLDDHRVGTFRRLDDGSPLQDGQVRMRYRVRNEEVKFATNAFFFEEGQADRYASALYGEFRVAGDGEALLVELRDADFRPLSEPLSPRAP